MPSGERSWIGRAYSRHSELEAQPRDFFGLDCQTVSGTPADCVNIALGHLCAEPPDAVISGLNIGQNVAMPLLWSSGTFAAAVEGAGWGLPAFAFSMRLEKVYYDYCRLRHGAAPEPLLRNIEAASEHAAQFIVDMLSKGECGAGVVVNVNYPIKYTRQTPFAECKPASVDLRSSTRAATTGNSGSFVQPRRCRRKRGTHRRRVLGQVDCVLFENQNKVDALLFPSRFQRGADCRRRLPRIFFF